MNFSDYIGSDHSSTLKNISIFYFSYIVSTTNALNLLKYPSLVVDRGKSLHMVPLVYLLKFLVVVLAWMFYSQQLTSIHTPALEAAQLKVFTLPKTSNTNHRATKVVRVFLSYEMSYLAITIG